MVDFYSLANIDIVNICFIGKHLFYHKNYFLKFNQIYNNPKNTTAI